MITSQDWNGFEEVDVTEGPRGYRHTKPQSNQLAKKWVASSFIQRVIRENENVSWVELKYLLREYYRMDSKPHNFFFGWS